MKQLNPLFICMLLLSQAYAHYHKTEASRPGNAILYISTATDADLAKAMEYKKDHANLNFSCFAQGEPVQHQSVFGPTDVVKHIIPDTSINNKLYLNKPWSIYDVFGNIDSLLRGDGFPEMYVKNSSGSQYLRMIQHLGTTWNSINEFEFGYTTDLPDSIPTTSSDMLVFVTGSGIHLGMTEAEVIKIKGTSYTKTVINKKERLISYVMKYWDKDESRFLSRYKMEIYYAHYICKDGKVKKVKFGFDYF